MTQPSDPRAERARIAAKVQGGAAERLSALGYSAGAVDALLTLDAVQFQYQRRMAKGEFLQLLIARMGLDLEPSQLQGLYAVSRITYGILRPEPMPATIGLVAEELSLDPSRASRIVADLVGLGYVTRQASQADGRVSVIAPTPKGHALIARLRHDRWALLMDAISDWSEADILRFSDLFGRYVDGMNRVMTQAATEQDATPSQP